MLDGALALLILLLAWPLALFPALMKLLANPQPAEPPPADDELPPLTLIICALNEERVIRAKMENCLELDYPPGKLSVVVINDGSRDATADIVREYESRMAGFPLPHGRGLRGDADFPLPDGRGLRGDASPDREGGGLHSPERRGIKLIDHAARRGKVANLNEAAPAAATPLVAFSDANVLYEPKALRHLAARFRDPMIGGATGRVALVNTSEEIRHAEQGYYSLEWAIHAASTRIHSMVGCDGAMYVLRRELFRVCPEDTLIEDFVQALAVVRQGSRMVFVPEALAWEEGPRSLGEEYRRKVRIAAGAAQALLRGNGWPTGAPARFWWLWLSHKLLRWLAPVTALAALALAAANPASPLSQAVLVAGAALGSAAVVRVLTGWRHPLVNAPFYLLFALSAGLAGLIKGLAGRQSVLWSKAGR